MSSQITNEHYQYIHNVFGSFVNGLADFLSKELYPDTKEVVISTYAKAVQHYKNMREEGGEKHTPRYPLMIIDPQLDMEPDEVAGKFLYQYPNLRGASLLGSRQWGPYFYKDENVEISPVLNRYKGSFQVSIICRSIYEAIDMRILAFQFFGGKDRIIYPKNIEGYFILPDSFRYYEYNNLYTGQSYELDWEHYQESPDKDPKTELILIKTINKNKWVYPFSLTPWLILRDIADDSNKGGGEDLSEFRITLSIDWESYIPTHLCMVTYMFPYQIPRAFFEMSSGIAYRDSYSNSIPDFINVILGDIDSEGQAVTVTYDAIYKLMWKYLVTIEDIDNLNNDTNVDITLPRHLMSSESVRLYTAFGELNKDWEYKYDIGSDTITLIYVDLKSKLKEDDLITVAVFERT